MSLRGSTLTYLKPELSLGAVGVGSVASHRTLDNRMQGKVEHRTASPTYAVLVEAPQLRLYGARHGFLSWEAGVTSGKCRRRLRRTPRAALTLRGRRSPAHSSLPMYLKVLCFHILSAVDIGNLCAGRLDEKRCVASADDPRPRGVRDRIGEIC